MVSCAARPRPIPAPPEVGYDRIVLRRLFTLACVLSSLLAAAVLALWARSAAGISHGCRYNTSSPTGLVQVFVLSSRDGLEVWVERPFPYGSPTEWERREGLSYFQTPLFDSGLFWWGKFWWIPSSGVLNSLGIYCVPHLPFAGVLLIPPACGAALWWRRRRRRTRGFPVVHAGVTPALHAESGSPASPPRS